MDECSAELMAVYLVEKWAFALAELWVWMKIFSSATRKVVY